MTVFHASDEVGVRNLAGVLEHGVVCEITRVVWIKLDNQILDVPFDPADDRLTLWGAA